MVNTNCALEFRHAHAVQRKAAVPIIVECVVPAEQLERESGLPSQNIPDRPAANHLVQHAAAIQQCPALAEWQIERATGVDDVPQIEAPWPLVVSQITEL